MADRIWGGGNSQQKKMNETMTPELVLNTKKRKKRGDQTVKKGDKKANRRPGQDKKRDRSIFLAPIGGRSIREAGKGTSASTEGGKNHSRRHGPLGPP